MSEAARFALLPRLGLEPTVGDLVREALDTAFAAAEATGREPITALDAGCGRVSALAAYKLRIGRFIGADVHRPPPGSLPHLDEFAQVDVCGSADAFAPGTFDVVLSSFTVEHFADPAAAFRNLRHWLRPGGSLVLTTVNRRHPFVAAYLGLPAPVRAPLQRFVKATAADAHPLVGACNSVPALRTALLGAGFADVDVRTAGHLARAWGRRWPTFVLGTLGDLAARPFPGARSTIVAVAAAPADTEAARA